ncbi:hypothetical protein ACW14X_07070 [Nocardioides sp. YJ-D4]
MASQEEIDRQIRAYYGGLDWDEGARLTSRSAQGSWSSYVRRNS